jgi:hypothetical protein
MSDGEAAGVADSTLRPCRVLVAVEPPLLSELLVRLLGQAELDVTTAWSSDEAVDVVVRNTEVPSRVRSDDTIDVELPAEGASNRDVAIVSGPAGESVAPVATVEALTDLIRRLCHR